MNKRGFTLIELLAVIVILAIIAVIAVPIVLNIIDETKNNATLRSAEMYMDAVELSIADRVMHYGSIADDVYSIMSNGNICLKEYKKEGTPEIETCGGNTLDKIKKEDVLEVEVKGEKPTSGTIYIKGGQIFKEIEEVSDKKTTLVISEKTIEPIEENGEVKFGIVGSNNSKEETIEVGKMSICNPLNVQTEGTYTAGDKYECDVDPNKDGYDYTFYVLNATSTEVNLIMDQNINSDGTPAGMTGIEKNGDNVYNLVAWNSSDSNIGGPVDAMQFLYNATKTWTNIAPLNYIYNDKEYQGTTDSGYTSFKAEAGVLTITKFDGITTTTIGSETEPLRARMPIYSGVWKSDFSGKVTEKGEVADRTTVNAYLYETLSQNGFVPYGYWTLSSSASYNTLAWTVGYGGSVGGNPGHDNYYGVRPVINLKI